MYTRIFGTNSVVYRCYMDAQLYTWVILPVLILAVNFSWSITVMSHAHHGVTNHRQLDCLFNGLFRVIIKKTSKLRIEGPLFGKTSEFPSQRTSNAQRISVSLRHDCSVIFHMTLKSSQNKKYLGHYVIGFQPDNITLSNYHHSKERAFSCNFV